MARNRRKPVVLMFQPTEFRVVKGKELKRWESLLAQRVGLAGKFNFAGTETISGCPDDDD